MPQVYVRTTFVLDDLQSAFKQFASDLKHSAEGTEVEVRRTLTWLAERVSYWKQQVIICQREVETAQAELDACLRWTSEDDHGDCSAEEAALARALQRLQYAQEQLSVALLWQSRVTQSAEKFRRTHQRIQADLGGDDAIRPRQFLSQAQASLERYSAARPDLRGTYSSIQTAGKGMHLVYEHILRENMAAEGKVERVDFLIEQPLRDASGNELQDKHGKAAKPDFVDLKEHRIIDIKPIHAGQSEDSIRSTYRSQFARYQELYMRAYGVEPTIEVWPYFLD